ncbi:putative aldouronate transport system substrate-binding protein [Paenibacillus silagei]|uniref:Aldouronate transport system substrate-binding protein n=2 Tax=Paenibacillus silagei TaxID=1670801 RepID=A0ABS4NKL7_9BACL|nr:putative aldouronate transport system substrate-binding protein [Paenibacillus silagei]
MTVMIYGCPGREEQTGTSGTSGAPNPPSADTGHPAEGASALSTVKLDMMENGWSNTPTDEADPWRKWIKDRFNIEMTMDAVPPGELEAKLLLRFSSSQPPDLIFSWDRNLIMKLHKQEVLLDDWTPYLSKLPHVMQTWNSQMRAHATVEGRIIGLPKLPEAFTWALMIRKDWLDALQLSPPATDTELLEVLRKFTYGDPDQNGKDDTWGISSAGSGSDVGELSILESMYGPSGFHIGPDGTVQHSVVNGTHLKFLAFMRTIVKEKLIDPDWYTQSWEQRKPKLFGGHIGIVHYPGAIVQEGERMNGATGRTVNWWDALQVPKGAEFGGRRPPAPIAGGLLAVSAQAAGDAEKMERILRFIDSTVYPTEGYWALRWGVGVNGQKVTDFGREAKFISLKEDPYRQEVKGANDWGTWVATSQDRVLESLRDSPGPADIKQLELDNKAMSMDSYTNYHELLHLDPQISSDLKKLTQEFDLKYILGEDSDYERFKQEWLQAGGRQLLEEASSQLRVRFHFDN